MTALRCVLRFLYLRGALATDLAGAVPAVANWRQASLPKSLPHKEVKQLLGSCDRRTHGGPRDFAVLVLLVRLGLRAGEVADLELDDFDWTRGEVVIQGKGREDRLPLPIDVGEAVVAYLRRGRPQLTSCRKLFISSRAPLGGDLCERGDAGCPSGLSARRADPERFPSSPAHGCHSDAASRRLASRDRSSATASPSGHDSDLRQGRSACATRAGPALAGRCVMSGLRDALNDYLALRRGLGYKLERAESLLSDFVNYIEGQSSPFVTTKLALEWASLPSDASPNWKAERLCMVRGFAKYVHAFDPRTELPSPKNSCPSARNGTRPTCTRIRTSRSF